MEPRVICLFGSSVDPPTKAHVEIIRYLANSAKYDEVWLLPVYKHIYDSKSDQALFEQRVQMCKLALGDIKGAEVKTTEKELYDVYGSKPLSAAEKLGTADLLVHLTTKYPGDKFHFVMGADSFRSFCDGRWKLDGMINNLAQLEVVQRDETPTQEEMQGWKYGDAANFHKIEAIPSNISSTKARKTKKVSVLKRIVPGEVANYIKANGLYSFKKKELNKKKSGFRKLLGRFGSSGNLDKSLP